MKTNEANLPESYIYLDGDIYRFIHQGKQLAADGWHADIWRKAWSRGFNPVWVEMTAMTTAQKIADFYHNDGQIFTVDGMDIDEVAEGAQAYSYRKGDCTLHVFADDSMIVIGNFWDIITVVDGMLTDSNGGSWGSLDDWQ